MKKVFAFIVFIISPIFCMADDIVDFQDDALSKQDVIEALAPSAEPEYGSTRGIRVIRGISMSVHFEFNSSRLSLDSKQNLDVVATALNSGRLAGSNFRIEGHTDAVGSDAYNMDLSEQRANAVKQYLIERGRVPGSQLEVRGHGERKLLPEYAPTDAHQRRVVILNLGQ